MKKFVGKATAMAMAVVMMSGAVGVTALAEEKSQSKDTVVRYSTNAEYEWTVPAEVVFLRDNKGTDNKIKKQAGNVEILKNIIENNYKVKVTVKGSGTSSAFTITDSNSNDTLNYSIYKGNETVPIGVNGLVMEMEAGHTGKSDDLTFELDLTEYEKAGTYTGTATFTAEAVDTSSSN